MTYFRYVRHHDVERYAALVWREVDDLRPCHHDFWSTIMRWEGKGEPKEPEKEK